MLRISILNDPLPYMQNGQYGQNQWYTEAKDEPQADGSYGGKKWYDKRIKEWEEWYEEQNKA